MTDNVLDHLKRFKEPEIYDEDEELVADYGIVGWLRGTRDRALFIDFWLKSGNCVSLAYGILEKVIYNPSEDITLLFMGTKVVIKGTCLDKPLHGISTLRDGITRHRVTWIRECEKNTIIFGDEKQLMITSITV